MNKLYLYLGKQTPTNHPVEMKKITIYSTLLLASFLCWTCIDEIKLNVDTEQRSLVVDGFVTDSLGNFNLKLSESSVIGIGNDNILDPISGATVQLMDSEGDIYPYTELDLLGTYQLTNFKALRGKNYFIDILLPNGKHYQSKPAQLRSNSSFDSANYTIETETFTNNAGQLVTNELLSVKINANVGDSAEPPYLRWRVEGEYVLREVAPFLLNPKRCFIKENVDLNNVQVFDGSEVNGGILMNQEIARTTYNFRFTEQFCFHIYQFSISPEEYDYWRNIKEIIEVSGSLFDPPPGKIIGNIYNVDNPDEVAAGYFSVASVYFTRTFINGIELGNIVAPKCGARRNIPFGCDDCLLIRNSTTEVPDYWEL